MEQYDKMLTISNIYIEQTGSYDILTRKKEQLQDMLDEMVEAAAESEDGRQEKTGLGEGQRSGQVEGE